jgi:hypothetical protein
MSLVFLPLIIALGICLLPIWLLPRRNFQRPRDYFIASQPTPPDVMRNSAVGYPLRIAAFGPLFVWGASGDLWPALIGAGCCGLGVYLIYALRASGAPPPRRAIEPPVELQQNLPQSDSCTATKRSHCAAVKVRPRRAEFHAPTPAVGYRV